MKKCAIVIGHEPNKPGAVNLAFGMSEYDFNKELASLLANELREMDVNPIIIYRDTLSKLPRDINCTMADVCISLHSNAFNTKATGTETLFFESSTEGRKLAEYVQMEMVQCLQLKDRGTKPITAKDNGGYLLVNTDMPTILVEPFFIDNNVDYTIADAEKVNLAKHIAKGIKKYTK